MSNLPHLVGMIHLAPLPGAPGFTGSLTAVLDHAVGDAVVLAEAGFPALMVENFGDTPFFASRVSPETISSMALAVDRVITATSLPTGVNVLRNDAEAALAVAVTTGARMIRVNVLTGLMYTDQGPIIGRAAQLLRMRSRLGSDVEIWADAMVKHATAPPGAEIVSQALDTVERGGADVIIVSGSATGAATDPDEVTRIREALPTGIPVVVGSGTTAENLETLVDIADGFIVGSSIKVDGKAANPVDRARAEAFLAKARILGIV